ncbi:BspA family leucine-rich repeat surface protein [Mycoplasma sp. HU2014]|uniref:BspA family leucine-rich repeat surface protein n=1 Tax=Mycoplasma sp. HU2014 TaxID=1664275 RepID=UPI00067B8FC5|nr:BspA family leucine-rich repeat surface protein [Mycoplasma sp. HU2014]KNG79347.1 PARCEL domain-containing protein [Mycoplasma sp. HU2014]
MNKKTLTILLSTLGGLSIAGAVGGVVAYKMINKNNIPDPQFTREHLEYVDKIIRENNLSLDLFKLDSDGSIKLKPVFTIQKSEYINDEQGKPVECIKIGFSLMNDKSIQIEQFPETVSKVPPVLPKEITSLVLAFKNNINTEIDGIQHWNTSNIMSTTSMFENAENFNQPIGNWNTTNIINMNHMFFEAKNFDQDISSWNTSKVINMTAMFYGASNFNQDISNWDVSKLIRKIIIYGQKFTGWDHFNENAHSQFTGDKLPKFPK